MSQEVVCHVKMYFLYSGGIVLQEHFICKPETFSESGRTRKSFKSYFWGDVSNVSSPGERLKETLSSRFVIFGLVFCFIL